MACASHMLGLVDMSTLDGVLRKFEATEANLEKLEKLWSRIRSLLGNGPAFGAPPEYEELCLAFRRVLPALPAIDGFRVEDELYDFDSIGRMRLDAFEIGEIDAEVSVGNLVEAQGRALGEYRFRLAAKRNEVVRARGENLISYMDELLHQMVSAVEGKESNQLVESLIPTEFSAFKDAVAEVDTLRGSNARPPRWGDLHRHLHFGMVGDVLDIQRYDWPAAKDSLRAAFYGEYDPLPVEVSDLAEIVPLKPHGRVATKLKWSVLSDEEFERLIFVLIADTEGYENPEWLQQTHAPDRGRDLSVTRVDIDQLAGVRRHRVIVQCKHRLTTSVSATDVSDVRAQMELWHPPRVDTLIMATSGRFTADAVRLIEQHNQSDRALHIWMWPESHLERLLAERPSLIAEFGLRSSD
jgi:hypothetical protein